jgi:hypothetical protein
VSRVGGCWLEPLAHAVRALMPTLSEALLGVAKRDLDEDQAKTDWSCVEERITALGRASTTSSGREP